MQQAAETLLEPLVMTSVVNAAQEQLRLTVSRESAPRSVKLESGLTCGNGTGLLRGNV